MMERREVFEENKKLRKENIEARKAFRGEREDKIVKYKEAFNSRLKSRLDRISDSKLEKVATKVDAAIEKIENNSRISDTKKDALMSQLIALKEIIDEKLEDNGAEEDTIDLDELFDVD